MSDSNYAQRPQGVRVAHTDGTSTPCELAYEGREDGVHMWRVLQPVGPGDEVHVDVLPANTGIRWPLPGE